MASELVPEQGAAMKRTPDATDSGNVSHWFPQNRSVLYAPVRDAGDTSTLNVRVFVDGSALEIFVNDRVALTGLVFDSPCWRNPSTCEPRVWRLWMYGCSRLPNVLWQHNWWRDRVECTLA